VKRKVLIIVENGTVPFDPRVWKEASSLHQNDYQVTVLCPRGHKGYEQGYEVIDGVHIYRHPMPEEGNTPLGYLFEYGCALFWEFCYTWWIFLRRGFQVIQGCNPPDSIFLIALPFKLLGVKYIFDHHDVVPELYLSKYTHKGLFYKVQVWLERLTFRSSDLVMSTNSSYRDIAVTRGGLNPENVFIVRNGPDLRTFKAVPPNPALKYGKPYLIGYVGTMSVQEGLDILLEVVLHIKNSGRRDIHFTCVGGGPGLAGLRKMVQDKNLEDMVNFTGRIPDEQLLEILSTADVCVNPDRPCEMNDISTMIKIMEYMALGKPIVQFDSKEGRFSAEEASFYADKTDQVADFAAKILWLLERPEERNRMGEFGRRRVEKELAWEHSVKNLLAAYERVFSKRTRSVDLTRRRGYGQKADQGRHTAITGDDANTGAAQLRARDVDQNCSHPSCVLITPARNEGAFIEKTIESMIRQTILPLKWVIVDDGSTDRTAEIVSRYLAQHPWMEMVQMPQRRDRSFAAKVGAFNAGYERVNGLQHEIIGNLDADIAFEKDYLEFLLKKFSEDPTLGVAGTVFREEGYSSERDSFEGHNHVAGGCQLFRRRCFEEIGGFIPNEAGGVDWIAVTTARMMGWKTESFREKWFFHYRQLGTAERSILSSQFSYGKKDYYLGGHPVWELSRVAYRAAKQPFVIGGLALGLGYCWALLRRTPRPVSRELMAFRRQEQMVKLKAILKSLVRFKRVDNFNVERN
jgi:glycosyltransferase involved in cell wall biosynthesis